MALDDLVRSAVALANTITADLQDTVTHEAWSSQDAYGKPTYAAGVSRQALVEFKSRLLRSEGGQEVLARAKVTFIGPVTVNVKDRITLPDSTTGPILDVQGLGDPDTNGKYLTEVWLG